ncbi:hypothetical protein HZA57_08920 [Candidatus Poribacteria bacterium]|nr:hypothetical protein [Candidatus Poribacteria bacterium]
MTPLSPDELRSLVEQTVREVLARREGVPSAPPKQAVTFVFTEVERGEREGRILLSQIRRQYPCEVVLTPCYIERYGEKWVREDAGDSPVLTKLCCADEEKLLRRTGVLVLPHPSRRTVASAAICSENSLGGRLMLGALMRGIPVAMGVGDCDPASWPSIVPGTMRSGPRSLGQLLMEYVRTLENWGVEVRRGGELLRVIEVFAQAAENQDARPATAAGLMEPGARPRRRFYTAGDVRSLAREGQSAITLGPDDRITDEARAVAAELGVKIE